MTRLIRNKIFLKWGHEYSTGEKEGVPIARSLPKGWGNPGSPGGLGIEASRLENVNESPWGNEVDLLAIFRSRYHISSSTALIHHGAGSLLLQPLKGGVTNPRGGYAAVFDGVFCFRGEQSSMVDVNALFTKTQGGIARGTEGLGEGRGMSFTELSIHVEDIEEVKVEAKSGGLRLLLKGQGEVTFAPAVLSDSAAWGDALSGLLKRGDALSGLLKRGERIEEPCDVESSRYWSGYESLEADLDHAAQEMESLYIA